ncbi:hypothetical protein [uncultured Winogradskyella sp.]|uniref:hypothetical protein n=1 Tax=uncultured Winogradskyella sp. TaxID=395353 RepID=UPI00261D43AF|nr:hypothetical protein [uncultured Winogradskyella sp.]
MIKDFLISFKDNFKEKTRNPFLGTYLIVWIIRNWLLVYTLFNFDKIHNLDFKVNFIKTYYSENDFITNLLTNILWSLGLLILTYVLLNVSRFIINLSEKQITPWIYKITDSKSIVLKEEYDRLKQEKNLIENKLEDERENRVKLLNEISRLENRIDELSLDNLEEPQVTSIEKGNSQKSNIEIYQERLKKKDYTDKFVEFALQGEKSSVWFSKNNEPEHIKYFFKIGLIEVSNTMQREISYKLTSNGRKVFEVLRLIEN